VSCSWLPSVFDCQLKTARNDASGAVTMLKPIWPMRAISATDPHRRHPQPALRAFIDCLPDRDGSATG